MTRQVILLRGVNVGRNNRLPMGELRTAMAGSGFEHVETYLQSGNIVLTSERPASEVAALCSDLIADRFGLRVAAVGRTAEEMAEVVTGNPLAALATVPKYHLVAFLGGDPGPDLEARLAAAAEPGERFAIRGRHVYTWHPQGPLTSKLWGVPGAGVTVTARNWATVTRLREILCSGS